MQKAEIADTLVPSSSQKSRLRIAARQDTRAASLLIMLSLTGDSLL